MVRIVIFGNSGSGKSTLAKRKAAEHSAGHLDLDTIAWKKDEPGVRADGKVSAARLKSFIDSHESWVVEGCYASLLSIAMKEASEIIFLNPGVEACQRNGRARPWEPHKYESKELQDRNLDMLLSWGADYKTRQDEFSLSAHKELYKQFSGRKSEVTHQDYYSAV